MRDLTKMTNIEDLRVVCKRNVPKMFYEYVDTGSWTQATYRENVSDFNPIKFKQRILVDMDNRTLETTLLGQKVKFPAMTAPVGFMGMMWADGEIHMAKAAQKFGIPFTLSTMSICSIEDLVEAGVEPFWFQLYVMRDREFMKDLIRRAKEAKCSALMVTVDLQVLGNRHRDIKNGLSTPPKFTIPNILNLSTKIPWGLRYVFGNHRWTFRNIAGHAKNVSDLSSLSSWTKEQFDPSLSWKDIAEIKE
ncbi:alpha-hydroxy acid oxidase, partial [Capnocytophaga gingivalis]